MPGDGPRPMVVMGAATLALLVGPAGAVMAAPSALEGLQGAASPAAEAGTGAMSAAEAGEFAGRPLATMVRGGVRVRTLEGFRARPRTWIPDRTPRMGLGMRLTNLRWSGWGRTAGATAQASMMVCAAGRCSTDRVRLRVYRPMAIPGRGSGRMPACGFCGHGLPSSAVRRSRSSARSRPGGRCDAENLNPSLGGWMEAEFRALPAAFRGPARRRLCGPRGRVGLNSLGAMPKAHMGPHSYRSDGAVGARTTPVDPRRSAP